MSARTTSHPSPSGCNHHNHISDITIKFDKSQKSVKSVQISIDENHRDVPWERTGEQTLRAGFTPPLDISSSHRITLHPRYRSQLSTIFFPKKGQDITIDVKDLLQASPRGEGDRREWRRLYGKTEIIMGFSFHAIVQNATESRGQDVESHNIEPGNDASLRQDTANPDFPQGDDASLREDADLPPTTDEILRICPRFRILVIGKSGVGKSSLINKAFGATQARVSHVTPGKADINTEIPSADNKPFVLHDSQGFEHGEDDNVQKVQQFIDKRSKMPQIKDKLHAVWLCFEIPRAGGRILETGVEEFLNLKTTGRLGPLPVIAVFTKFDLLVTRASRVMDESRCVGLNDKETLELSKKDADAVLHDICIRPFEELVGTEVPHVTVSTKKGYENTLSDLIKFTYDNVHKHVAKEASIVSAMAQKVNSEIKINASIEVGRARYWRGLASSTNFPGKTLRSCLEVIHKDIIVAWGFDDKHMHLRSAQFKALMSNMVDDLADQDAPNPNRSLTVGLSMVGTVAGIVSALAGPAAPIVIPIAAGFVLAKWVYDVYQQSHNTLRRLMAYIVDLTLILQLLFCLVASDNPPISRRLVKLAFNAYNESGEKEHVHSEIAKHVKNTNFFDRADRDSTLDKIIELIDRYRVDPAEVSKLKGQPGVPHGSGEHDEPWNVQDGR